MTPRHHELIFDAAPPVAFGGISPGDARGISHATAEERLDKAKARLIEIQKRMKAAETWSLLAIFQGMDAAGKDSTVAHVFGGLDPAALQVTAFKRPSAQEARHDCLWREHQAVPAAGQFGVFNRSHYENVLVPLAHPELGFSRHLPASQQSAALHLGQMEDFVSFERMLARHGVVICKFFLHVSSEEQRQRLLARLEDPLKSWKFEPADLVERRHWDAYQRAYETVIAATATPFAPWAIIPADSKPAARAIVAEILVDRLSALDIALPEPDPDILRTARHALQSERGA